MFWAQFASRTIRIGRLSLYIGIIFPHLPILVVERRRSGGVFFAKDCPEIVHLAQKLSHKEKMRKIKKKMRNFFQKTLAK